MVQKARHLTRQRWAAEDFLRGLPIVRSYGQAPWSINRTTRDRAGGHTSMTIQASIWKRKDRRKTRHQAKTLICEHMEDYYAWLEEEAEYWDLLAEEEAEEYEYLSNDPWEFYDPYEPYEEYDGYEEYTFEDIQRVRKEDRIIGITKDLFYGRIHPCTAQEKLLELLE